MPFFAERPRSYEETVKRVRDWCLQLKRLRDEERVPEETSGIIVVDSLRKLVPKGLFEQITKVQGEARGKRNNGDVRTRMAQIKAQMNAAWWAGMSPDRAAIRARPVVPAPVVV